MKRLIQWLRSLLRNTWEPAEPGEYLGIVDSVYLDKEGRQTAISFKTRPGLAPSNNAQLEAYRRFSENL